MKVDLEYSAPVPDPRAAAKLAGEVSVWAGEACADLRVFAQPYSVVVMVPPDNVRSFKEAWPDFFLTSGQGA